MSDSPISLDKYRARQRIESWEERRQPRHEKPELDVFAFSILSMTFVCGTLFGLVVALLAGWIGT